MDFLTRIFALLLFASSVFAQELDRVAVIVNDGVVLESDIQQKMSEFKKNATLNGQKIPSDEVLREDVLDELIISELQLQIADKVGIKISDEELNVTVKRLAQQNNLDIEAFIKVVEERGDSYSELREEIRKSLKINRVQQGRIQNKIQISREELDNFLNTEEAQNQLGPELKVKQILIRNNSSQEAQAIYEKVLLGLADGINIDNFISELSEDNGTGDLGWRKLPAFPELFSVSLKNMKIGELSEPIKSGAGEHLLFLEDKRGPTVTFEKQWDVRHILLIPNRIRPEDASEALITELKKRIQSGDSFADVASEYSDDPGSKQEGGNLGWAGEGVYDDEFERQMIKSNLNELTDPFLSQFGWHILEVMGTRVEDKTKEKIEDRAFSYLFNRKFEEELETDLQELRADAFIEIKELD
ncbi:MAG: rotamase [SAR86 cluster bacterium]|uniref:Chaperone SurA n=1 Tax=SAR86 cluster bacterium TaxID=2030880 RepID=A0A520MT46_9GAMM|nr:rotamase [Gammaproteobacteria bacterium]RZO24392.1 MAG: rotamase [SAR86 cluster bacterium]